MKIAKAVLSQNYVTVNQKFQAIGKSFSRNIRYSHFTYFCRITKIAGLVEAST